MLRNGHPTDCKYIKGKGRLTQQPYYKLSLGTKRRRTATTTTSEWNNNVNVSLNRYKAE